MTNHEVLTTLQLIEPDVRVLVAVNGPAGRTYHGGADLTVAAVREAAGESPDDDEAVVVINGHPVEIVAAQNGDRMFEPREYERGAVVLIGNEMQALAAVPNGRIAFKPFPRNEDDEDNEDVLDDAEPLD